MQFFDNKGSNYNKDKEDVTFDSTGEDVETNRKNQEYYDKLMKDSGSKKGEYFDRNDLTVKLILLVLGIIIVVGTIYIILRGM